nr:hypothetical protein [Marinicella sp. W31]MDC2877332.1 hypothetical protein [Marinicella sp. W31]
MLGFTSRAKSALRGWLRKAQRRIAGPGKAMYAAITMIGPAGLRILFYNIVAPYAGRLE